MTIRRWPPRPAIRDGVRNRLAGIARRLGLTADHLAIPRYYLPYAFGDGLAGDAPLQCDFELTYRCNMRCRMCPQAAYRDHRLAGAQIRQPSAGPPRAELSTAEIAQALSDLARAGTETVLFTGGEAFLRPDLLELIRHARQAGLHVVVLSNGSLIPAQTARHLVEAQLDALTLSLDGAAALHDRIRRREGAFARLMDATRLIEREKARQGSDRPHVSLSAVIQRMNQDQLHHLVDAASDLHAEALTLNFPFYTTAEAEAQTQHLLGNDLARGAKPEHQSALTEHRGLAPHRLVQHIALARRHAIQRSLPLRLFPDLRDAEIPRYLADPRFHVADKCLYPWKNMRINAWGEAYPCSVDVCLGNLRESGILAIWNGERYRAFRRRLRQVGIFPQCTKCCALGNRAWNRLPRIRSSAEPQTAVPG